MPELPEVEVVKRQLEKYILQRKIDSVKAEPIKLVNFDKNISDRLRGLQFVGIERVGKLLIFETDKAGVFVLCHLKMTGQLIFVGESGLAGGGHTLTTSDLVLPNKHTHVTVNFQDGAKLFFNDLRKFGYFKIADKTAVEEAKKNYGLEPISDKYSIDKFRLLIKNKKTSVKAFLLNQRHLAGLGNIYVDEACFRAKVAPDRVVGGLNSGEQAALFKACREVLLESIAAGGTTFYSFTNAEGGSGGYGQFLQVFQREGEKCFRCGTIIEKKKLAGRGTHWCPECQK